MGNNVFTKVVDLNQDKQGFSSGAVRDTEDAKGSPYLIPNDVIFLLIQNCLKGYISNVVNPSKRLEVIFKSISEISTVRNEINEEDILKFATSVFHQACLLTADLNGVNYSENIWNPYTYALRRLAQHYQNGAEKYEKNNWRKGIPMSRYFNSMWRHLLSISEKDKSEDHCAAVVWNIVGFYTTYLDVKAGSLDSSFNDFPFSHEGWFGRKK